MAKRKFPFKATFNWSGKGHQSLKQKHSGKGLNSDKAPATVQLSAKPSKGKIRSRFGNARMQDLKRLNPFWLAFWLVRRIAGVLFNPHGPNLKWVKIGWKKLIGIQDRVPEIFAVDQDGKETEWAIAEGIACETPPGTRINEVEVIGEHGKFYQLKPGFVVQLVEVNAKTGKPHVAGLRWRAYADDNTGEIWVEKTRLQAIK